MWSKHLPSKAQTLCFPKFLWSPLALCSFRAPRQSSPTSRGCDSADQPAGSAVRLSAPAVAPSPVGTSVLGEARLVTAVETWLRRSKHLARSAAGAEQRGLASCKARHISTNMSLDGGDKYRSMKQSKYIVWDEVKLPIFLWGTLLHQRQTNCATVRNLKIKLEWEYKKYYIRHAVNFA